MESLNSVFKSLAIPTEISASWMEQIKQQYSEEKRHFHNFHMLEMKLLLIEEFVGNEPFKKALALASLFQYYYFDVKSDLKNDNCEVFKHFINQTNIKEVISTSWDSV